jgi:MFS superfamily sulfate permease-like transporter
MAIRSCARPWRSAGAGHRWAVLAGGDLSLRQRDVVYRQTGIARFAFGLALTIILKQVASVVGVHLTDANLVRFAPQLLEQLPQWNWPAAGVAAVALLLLSLFSRFPRVPGGLLVVVIGIVAGQWLNLSAHGVKLIGSST